MDLNIQMKSLALVLKFIKRDMQHIAAYPYYLQKPPTPPAVHPHPLPRATPESMGISSARVQALFAGVDAAPGLAPHALMLLRHGRVIAEAGWAPYTTRLPHMLYSMSKSVTSTAVGIAADEGLLALDERLCDVFPEEYAPLPLSLDAARALTIRHLLTMSTGVRFNEVGSVLCSDWVREYLQSGAKFKPGAAFDYNSMNSYMLAAALKKRTGQTLVEFLRPRLFEPLGIEQFTWETCPMGVEKGGWGLNLLLEDAAKLGQLYLQRGAWTVDGTRRQLLSESWVREATREQIATPAGELKHGYGYQIWMGGLPGSFQFNGAFGQYVVVLPQYDAVVAMYSGSGSLFAQGPLPGLIEACLDDAGEPLPENAPAQAALARVLDGLTCRPVPPLKEFPRIKRRAGAGRANALATRTEVEAGGQTETSFARLLDLLDGRAYTLRDNAFGLFPTILQCVHTNFSSGTDYICFRREADALAISFYEGSTQHTLRVPPPGCSAQCEVCAAGEHQAVGVRGEYLLAQDGSALLRVTACFLETPHTRVITMAFSEDTLTVNFDESPTLELAMDMLFELTGKNRLEYYRDLIPLVRKERLQAKLRDYCAPSVEGKLLPFRAR